MLVLHQGSVYRRVALTSKQKTLKKNYLLEQQQQADHIPTFEEVLVRLKPYLDLVEPKRAKKYYDQPTGYEGGPDGLTEWSTEQAQADMEREAKVLYDIAIKRLKGLDGKDCWRAIKLPAKIDPTQHDRLGGYWTDEKRSASIYVDKGAGQKVVYRGRIDQRYIHKNDTVTINSHLEFGPAEQEVRFYKGSPIFVYDVTLEDGSVLPIEDYRTC